MPPPLASDPTTVYGVLERTAREHGTRPALSVRRAGAWRTITWNEYLAQVRGTARGLMALGVEPGSGVAILGFNSPEWFLADVGAIAAGGLPAGIYTTNSPEQCRYIAEHAQAAVVLVENAGYLERMLQVRADLPRLRALVVMDGSSGGEGVYTWVDLLRAGERIPEADLDLRIAGQRPDDAATLIYTSGTTGPPKAVALSHRNLTWTAAQLVRHAGMARDAVVLSYLPLSHIAEQIVSLHTPMAGGACTAFAESLEQLRQNLLEVRPHFFFGVPRVWEKLQAGMQAAGASASPLQRRLVAWARGVGLAAGYARQRGRRAPVLCALARWLVFSRVRKRLGLDRARFCAVSAAPSSPETLEFFLSLEIPLLEVYGMSEVTGPGTLSLPHCYRTGKAGVALPGTELRLAEDGEILMRGPHTFLGYHRDPAATAETKDAHGWVHSGDIGELDAEGFVRITDRKKELLITSGGKNVAPAPIEAQLRQIALVSQAVLIGDRRPYVTALLTLSPERWRNEAARAGSAARTPEEACACPHLRAVLAGQIEALNLGLARYESVRRFALLPRELSVEEGELTPTLKLKRRAIQARYAREIADLYGPEA